MPSREQSQKYKLRISAALSTPQRFNNCTDKGQGENGLMKDAFEVIMSGFKRAEEK